MPPEKLKGGTENLLLFLRQLAEPTVKWKRLKLLFVGEENVGKTTLLSCFNPKKGGQTQKRKPDVCSIRVLCLCLVDASAYVSV